MRPGIPGFGPHHHMLAMPATQLTSASHRSNTASASNGAAQKSPVFEPGCWSEMQKERKGEQSSIPHPRGLGRWECPFGKAHANED